MTLQHSHRFLSYSNELDGESSRIALSGDEHVHLRRVLRMKVGETVYVTNGRGTIVRGTISAIGAQSTVVEIKERLEDVRSPAPRTLALACLKKDAFEAAVRLCTELGITAFLPFASEHSHVKTYSSAFLDRLGRIALAAMKQSFQPILPAISAPKSFPDLLVELGRYDTVVGGDAGGPPLRASASRRATLIVVGPEAGLAGSEIERLGNAGCRFFAVSARRLRSETAAAAFAAVLFCGDADRSAPVD